MAADGPAPCRAKHEDLANEIAALAFAGGDTYTETGTSSSVPWHKQ